MVNDPKAFDTLQGWRVRPHEAAFHKGRYFAVVESPGAGLPALNRFVTALEAALPPGR